MTAPTRVGLVGLGIIAETHLAVLADLPDADLVFTADPDPTRGPVAFRGRTPAHYRSLSDALAGEEVDLIVIATPTSTHSAVAIEALTTSGARVLVEKPLVHDLAALDRLRTLSPTVDLDGRLMVAHHFAFAPEVVWAARLLDRHPEWGPVTTITCAFYDPYVLRGQEAFDAYGSSWADSGINQLSMLTRFVELEALTGRQETDAGASAWATARYTARGAAGLARLRTSWLTGSSSKCSALTLGEAGVEIWIDHTAMTGFAARAGELLAEHTNDGRVPRKVAHYRPLYEAVVSETKDPALSAATASLVTSLLHTAPA